MRELNREKKSVSNVKEIKLTENNVINVTKDENGRVLFKVMDVYELFGFRRTSKNKPEYKHPVKLTIRKKTAPYPAIFIPESDVIRIWKESESETADELMDRLFDEVLPDIREWAYTKNKLETEDNA